VRVLGSTDQPLAGVTVQWAIVEGQATLNPVQSSTNTSGETETSATMGGTAGTVVIRATVENLTVSFSLTSLDASAFATVSVGFWHACGVTADGAAYCWGWNEFGQLGDGTSTNRSTPVPVMGGQSFAAVSAGYYYTCGVTTGGSAYCWGDNLLGKLGDGTTTDRLTPVPVAGGLSFASVVAGRDHTCGLTPAGAAYCWGSNAAGELGDGTTDPRSAPVPAAGSLQFAELGVGESYSCGVTVEGSGQCWGRHEKGTLGDGTPTPSRRPDPAPVVGGLSFASLGVSFSHTCAVTSSGAAYCWGWNREGQLGLGTAEGPETCLFFFPVGGSTDCSTVPRPVAGGLSFSSLSVGASALHTCGVTAAGAAYCWGDNRNGDLGVGSTAGPELCVQVNSPDSPCSTTPVPVAGGLSFTLVSAGAGHTCGLTSEGAVYCWGVNQYGQLGDGTTTQRLTPVPIAVRD
jgi:alpha-tubulin suppressor-like RCC1 family protein